VDPANCDRSSTRADANSFNATVVGESLYYSYHTCGNLDGFNADNHKANLVTAGKNGALRVSFPGPDSNLYSLVYETDDLGDGLGAGVRGGANLTIRESGMAGSLPWFFADAMAALGIDKFEIVPLSNESRAYSPDSSFSACVHEVALGNSDMCVGNIWPLPFRREIASFGSTVYADYIHMVTFREAKESNPGGESTGAGTIAESTSGIWTSILEPFRVWCTVPNSEDQSRCDAENVLSWVYIFAALLYAAVILWVIEGQQNKEVFPSSKNSDQIKRSAFLMTQSFLGSSDHRLAPHTSAGRGLLMSVSFAVLILTTTYTANMTTSKIIDVKNNVPYTSLEDAISKGARICGLEALRVALTPTFPKISDRFVAAEGGDGAMDFVNMNAGKCDVVVTTKDTYMVERRKPENCDMVMNTQVLLTLECAIATTRDLQLPLAWLTTRAVSHGKYNEVYRKASGRFVDQLPDSCKTNTLTPIRSSNTAGPAFISMIGCTIALGVYILSYYRKQAKYVQRQER
jgi:hypothetical protein